jgi:uncharacterized protein
MAKLAYYASPVPDKQTWFETAEGYRIYRNTRIARTGSQFYFGRELKKVEGYDSLWDLKDDQEYEVFRPIEEVTSPETIASFEGKSVLDLHPSDKVLIDALDEYDGISQGHMQNVRVGLPLADGEFAGETPLLADLHVKNPELNLKVESGTRQVSCGYRFILAKEETGRLIMTKIRGNHVAVVPKGRAGREIAIGDSAPNDVAPELDPDNLTDEDLDAIYGGVTDAEPEPSMLSFFNGKPHAEGLKAYNQYLASTGRGPIPAGKK